MKKIIAIENGKVVDIFATSNEAYIQERKDARPDIEWREDEECSIGQIYIDGCYSWPVMEEVTLEDLPEEPEPEVPTMSDSERIAQLYDMVAYLISPPTI